MRAEEKAGGGRQGQIAPVPQLVQPPLDERRLRDIVEEGLRAAQDRGCDVPRFTRDVHHRTEARRLDSRADRSISGHLTSEVKTVLEKHNLADDQGVSDAVILRMERTQRKRKV